MALNTIFPIGCCFCSKRVQSNFISLSIRIFTITSDPFKLRKIIREKFASDVLLCRCNRNVPKQNFAHAPMSFCLKNRTFSYSPISVHSGSVARRIFVSSTTSSVLSSLLPLSLVLLLTGAVAAVNSKGFFFGAGVGAKLPNILLLLLVVVAVVDAAVNGFVAIGVATAGGARRAVDFS